MIEPINSPVYLLRRYAWDVLKNNTDMDENDYTDTDDGDPDDPDTGGLVPIVPLGEEPEINQYNKPYLVYGYAFGTTEDLYACQSGSMTFAVYATNFHTITKILNILVAAFGRQDDSASDVNEYTSTSGHPGSVSGIRFGTIDVGFVEGGTPEETEGGRMSGIINIRFEYFVDYNVKTRNLAL